jgi:hypothetical protein
MNVLGTFQVRDKNPRFTALLHYVEVAALWRAWRRISRSAQGAGISPLLASIFLHYVCDLWVPIGCGFFAWPTIENAARETSR